MKVIILAAGKGTRLLPLTKTTPKHLLEVKPGITLIDHTISQLPEVIDEVIVVVHHLKEVFQEWKNKYVGEKNIILVEQEILDGTFGALVSAKKHLAGEEKFMVLDGDNLYENSDLEAMVQNKKQVGVHRTRLSSRYVTVDVSGDGFSKTLRPQTQDELASTALCVTNTYILSSDVFDFQPMRTREDKKEIGLPHTLFNSGVSWSVYEMSSWRSVNTHEQLAEVRELLKGK